VTFDVARTLKGRHVARVTIKQFGRSDVALGRIPGMPTYAPGEEIVVFLRAESRAGSRPSGWKTASIASNAARAGAPPATAAAIRTPTSTRFSASRAARRAAMR